MRLNQTGEGFEIMGYRSDVVVAIQFDDLKHLRTFLAKCKLLGDAYLNEAISMYAYSRRQGAPTYPPCQIMFMTLHGVKWYEGYPDINAHHQLRRLAWEANAASILIRIGEEHDDTEWDINVPMYKENGCVLAELFSIDRKLYIEVDPDETVTLDELEKHYES